MNIINMLEGIEKLVVELLLWLIFIPKTLFKIISDPAWVVTFVEKEVHKKTDRFDGFVSPVLLFLTSSLVLFIIANHVTFEVGKKVDFQEMMTELEGIKGVLTGLAFLSLPLFFSLVTEVLRRNKLARPGIQRILYIQCFYFSPLILSIFAAGLLDSLLPYEEQTWIVTSSEIIIFVIFIWFLIVEVRLIAHELNSGKWKATGILFGVCMVVSLASFGYFSMSLQTYEEDANFNGDAEEYLNLGLPSSGVFTIIVGGYAGSEGDYKVALTYGSGSGIPEGAFQSRRAIASESTLKYGQFGQGTVRPDVKSTWKFSGSKGDTVNVKVIPLSNEFDVWFDVQDKKGQSLLEGDKPNYIAVVGAGYALLIGLALMLGIRSLFRKTDKTAKKTKAAKN